MVRSKGSFASPSPSARGCTDGSDGPILFASTAHAGQINPLLSIGGELSWRRVPGLWLASTDNRRADIEGAAIGSPIHFVSCGINDRTKELIEDPAFYAAFAHRGPMTTNTFLVAMRWMFNQERLTVEYQRMLAHIDHVQPRPAASPRVGLQTPGLEGRYGRVRFRRAQPGFSFSRTHATSRATAGRVPRGVFTFGRTGRPTREQSIYRRHVSSLTVGHLCHCTGYAIPVSESPTGNSSPHDVD